MANDIKNFVRIDVEDFSALFNVSSQLVQQ